MQRGYIYSYFGNKNKNKEYLINALNALESNKNESDKNKLQKQHINFYIGTAHFDLKQYKEAYNYYHTAYSLINMQSDKNNLKKELTSSRDSIEKCCNEFKK